MFSEAAARVIVALLGVYLLVGLAVAVAFVAVGVQRIDAAAAKGTLGFRALILPGCIALWPVIAWRWRAGGPALERSAHRMCAQHRDAAS